MSVLGKAFGHLHVKDIQLCIKQSMADIEDENNPDFIDLAQKLTSLLEEYELHRSDLLPAIKAAFQMGVYPFEYAPEEVVWWFDCARDAMSGSFKQLTGRKTGDWGTLGMGIGVFISRRLRELPGVEEAWRRFSVFKEQLEDAALEIGLFERDPRKILAFLNSSTACSMCKRLTLTFMEKERQRRKAQK